MNARQRGTRGLLSLLAALLLLGGGGAARAQSGGDEVLYSDSFKGGWQNWSWATTDPNSTSPVRTGGKAISVNAPAGTALYFRHNKKPYQSGPYTALKFWIHGGATGGQNLQIVAIRYNTLTEGDSQQTPVTLAAPAANTWTSYTVSLSSLGIANVNDFDGFWIQNNAGGTAVFSVDDVYLAAGAAPASVNISVNAATVVRTIDARVFGMNTVCFNPNGWQDKIAETVGQLNELGMKSLRFPGGTMSNDFDWTTNKETFSDGSTFRQWADLTQFLNVAGQTGASPMLTVNFGMGTPEQAAAWVAYCNATNPGDTRVIGTDVYGRNWGTVGTWVSLRQSSPLGSDDGKNFLRVSRSAAYNVKYWEIGNENYGSWTPWDAAKFGRQWDPYTYGDRFKDFSDKMKSVDNSVKVGVVITWSEGESSTYGDRAIVNPRTGASTFGWAPVMLKRISQRGTLPDFVIPHMYWQGQYDESDAYLLQSPFLWGARVSVLRQVLSDWLGSANQNIEIAVTEQNSVETPGKQTVSLVNGLLAADSMGQMLQQSQIASQQWWAFRDSNPNYGNSQSPLSDDPLLYGWRHYGLLDIFYTQNNEKLPTYYGLVQVKNFARGGDAIVAASSAYSNLSAYAAKRTDGKLSLMVVNKDRNNNLTGNIAISGFAPTGTATVYSYGKTQDNNAQSGSGSPDIAQTTISNAGTSFSYLFPSYSITVLVLSPTGGTVANPTFSPGAGTYSSAQSVTIGTTTSGASIRYTTDGTNPTSSSGNVYSSPVNIGSSLTLKAIAYKSGSTDSTVSSAAYTINLPGTTLPLKINVGGGAVSPFLADQYFSGGTIGTNTNTIDTSAANAAPAAVYNSERYGASTCTIPGLTAGGSYTVRLHFCENWFGAGNGGGGGSGSRLFNVAINGTNVLSNFDVHATAGGPRKALVKSFPATANGSGQIVIAFTNGSANNAQVNGVEILAAGSPPSAPTGLTATAGNAQVSLSWTASAGATSYNVKRSTTSGGPYSTVSSPTGTSYTNTGLTNGTAYYYVVTALNSNGESGNSNQASATPTAGSADTAQYNFEGTTHGFTTYGTEVTSITSSADRAFAGANSLKVSLNATSNANPGTVYVANPGPGLTSGTVITYRVWFPAGSALNAIQVWVNENTGGGTNRWTGNHTPIANLTAGQWNTITVTLPANASPVESLGVQFHFNAGGWTGTCYVDSISW